MGWNFSLTANFGSLNEIAAISARKARAYHHSTCSRLCVGSKRAFLFYSSNNGLRVRWRNRGILRVKLGQFILSVVLFERSSRERGR